MLNIKRKLRKRRENRMWTDPKYFEVPANNALLLGWYSLDGVLAMSIIPALKKMEEAKTGFPVLLYKEIGSDWVDHTKEDYDKAHKLWEEILSKIIRGFEASLELDETSDSEQYNSLLKEMDEGLQLFAKYFKSIWD